MKASDRKKSSILFLSHFYDFSSARSLARSPIHPARIIVTDIFETIRFSPEAPYGLSNCRIDPIHTNILYTFGAAIGQKLMMLKLPSNHLSFSDYCISLYDKIRNELNFGTLTVCEIVGLATQ